MASRSIEALAPDVRRKAVEFIAACKVQRLGVLIYCTLRSNSEQAVLYKSGRSNDGSIVTNCRPGESLHNPDVDGMAWAFDAVPLNFGKALWSDDKALELMGECGESVGLEWAGRWRGSLVEKVHFQLKGGVYDRNSS